MNREELMTVLIAPHVTEKSSLAMQNHNQYTFRVRRDATKIDVKKAVQMMFDVKVSAVQILNEPGKTRRFPPFVPELARTRRPQHRCFWGKGTSGRRQRPTNLVEVNPIYAWATACPSGTKSPTG